MNALHVQVEVYAPTGALVRAYTMNHDDPTQRRVLGEQCRNAFEGGQRIVTAPARITPDNAADAEVGRG